MRSVEPNTREVPDDGLRFRHRSQVRVVENPRKAPDSFAVR
ncbi:MAG: hypothetical protein BLITH_1158 [Brockia lithotrophica]|uniref:Uncharacterized protein n=1 Tax=Brockia lithotrophica TaxID=933949 RepID=A0A2T5G7M5_9BACL|nr:MAG: hypothetical protein BLITH_1158 [Brockia lithotrophica]